MPCHRSRTNYLPAEKTGHKRVTPVMTLLPKDLLDALTEFTNVGVDYFGPFIVKIGRRNKKR